MKRLLDPVLGLAAITLALLSLSGCVADVDDDGTDRVVLYRDADVEHVHYDDPDHVHYEYDDPDVDEFEIDDDEYDDDD